MTLSSFVWTLAVISVLLGHCTVQAKYCWPLCKAHERCVATDPGNPWAFLSNVCIPNRCFFRPRRGRCRSFRHPYHFHPGAMKCVRDRSGACYGRRNRFTTLEDCELTCMRGYTRRGI